MTTQGLNCPLLAIFQIIADEVVLLDFTVQFTLSVSLQFTLSSGNCGRLPLGVQPMLPKFWFQLRIHEQIDMSLTHEINMNLHEQWGYAHNQNLPTQLMGA